MTTQEKRLISQRKRNQTKVIWLNRKEDEGQKLRKKRNEHATSQVKKIPRGSFDAFDVTYERKPGRRNRNELQIHRERTVIQPDGYALQDAEVNSKKRMDTMRKQRAQTVQERSTQRQHPSEDKKVIRKEINEWKEQVARVGTGYRVRKDEKDPRKRRFDVGYADIKSYKRKEGREAVIDSSNMGRTLTGKGKDARVKVMNAVCDMEKRRPVSEYTGSGILRKSMVGKLKLKPTKAGGKE